MRRCPRSPAAGPLEDDNLLAEIFLRLPPEPSSLPRASLVCSRWRSLASDPGFSRRFRIHHSRSPPLLGCFDGGTGLSFVPSLDAPNRVPPERFSLRSGDVPGSLLSFGCRHGLALLCDLARGEIPVWEPITGHQHRLPAVPPGFNLTNTMVSGAVLRAAGHVDHFEVVFVSKDMDDAVEMRAHACVYSSETGAWGDLIFTPPSHEVSALFRHTDVIMSKPAVLVGGSLHWLLVGNFNGILKFDVERQSLAVVRVPVGLFAGGSTSFTLMRADDGGLGFLFVSGWDYRAQIWKRETNRGGVISWVLGRTFELDKLISLDPYKDFVTIGGFAEENNLVFLHTVNGLMAVQIQSLQFKKVSDTNIFQTYHPFECVYAAGRYLGITVWWLRCRNVLVSCRFYHFVCYA